MDLSDSVWLSLGGELRTRVEFWSNFGFGPANDDDFALHRLFLHTDWHFGEHWRLFVEGKFTAVDHRKLPGGARDALDADEGDLWNTFIEANYAVGNAGLTARVGRQELQFGKQRFISPLDWANNRRIFDGGVLTLKGDGGRWQVDAFVTSPVIIDSDEFNEFDHDHLFSGVYYTQKIGAKPYTLDAYFLAQNEIGGAVVEEDRYTLGARFVAPAGARTVLELEGAVQFGEEDDDDILAWSFTAEGTYTFINRPMKPFITLGVDYASGDDDPADGDIGTFDQLFPLGHAYLGYIDAVGRQNIIDARATIGAWPMVKKLRTKADVHFFWLADKDDGLYHAGGGLARSPIAGGVNVDERRVGTELDFTALYNFNRYTSMLVGYSHFFAGDFIDDTGPDDDIDFFYTQIGFQF